MLPPSRTNHVLAGDFTLLSVARPFVTSAQVRLRRRPFEIDCFGGSLPISASELRHFIKQADRPRIARFTFKLLNGGL